MAGVRASRHKIKTYPEKLRTGVLPFLLSEHGRQKPFPVPPSPEMNPGRPSFMAYALELQGRRKIKLFIQLCLNVISFKYISQELY